MLKEMVRNYETELMASMLNKIADGRERSAKEIADVIGMSEREVIGNFSNLSRDNSHGAYYRISRFEGVKKKYCIVKKAILIEKKYVAVNDDGQVDFSQFIIRKKRKITYIVTHK